MHVSAKRIAFLGLLLAFAMVLTLIGGYFEISTLFFMAAAAFCTGIAVNECGPYAGFAFAIAGVVLAFLLAPNKLYVLTYAAMSLYIYLREFFFDKVRRIAKWKHLTVLLWIIRFAIFNVMFLPILFAFPELFMAGGRSASTYIVMIAAAQIILVVGDYAYAYFMSVVWRRLRRNLHVEG